MGNCCAACREPDGTIYDFTKIKNATSCPHRDIVRTVILIVLSIGGARCKLPSYLGGNFIFLRSFVFFGAAVRHI